MKRTPHPSCIKVQEKLNRFLDNSLAGRDAIDLAAHLEICAACCREFRNLEAVRNAVRRLPAPASSDEVRARAFQKLEAGAQREKNRIPLTPGKRSRVSWLSLRSLVTWVPAITTVTAAAAAVGIVFLVPLTGSSPTVSPASPNIVRVPGDAEIHDLFTLHDAHAIEWTGDETLAQRDAAAQAHGALLVRADTAVTGNL